MPGLTPFNAPLHFGADHMSHYHKGFVAKRSTEAAAGQWLRRYVRGEASFRALEGLAIAIAGFITLIMTSYIAAFGLLFIGLHLGVRRWETFLHSGIFISLVLLVLAISFIGAYKNPWGVDYSGARVSWGTPISGDLLKGMTTLVCDLLFSGPRILFAACDSFGKALRLSRLDVPQVTAILLWLWERGNKATVEEVSLIFSRFNAVRILPQLRDIPGVIWLPKSHGVIFLSEEFRSALSTVISCNSEYQNAEEPSSNEDTNPDEHEQDIDNEIVEWYKTLGVPPFAPLHEVKRKYRQLVKIYHPDAMSDAQKVDGDKADDQIKRINTAYHNLIKNALRSSKE
jgi:hypothetical protein